MTDRRPFEDVQTEGDGFSIPDLKWRELVFTGAMRPDDRGGWTRDVGRPMSPFRLPGLFPDGQRFEVQRRDGRAFLRRLP